MLLTFLGVRGSTPAPGAEFVEFGGHTSCLTVRRSADAVPTLVLDAGTGLRALSPRLNGAAFDGSILLSHIHWDHMQGIPFFTAGDRDGSRVDVYLPADGDRSGKELIAQAMQPPTFPITPDGLRGEWTFTALQPGSRRIEGFDVTFDEIRHKGGRTFGYRVSDGGVDVAYLPDHVAVGPATDALEALLRDVDVLVHDAQFVEAERALADDYGHSTVGDAVTIASKYGAKSLVLFHHGPQRTDRDLGQIERQVTASFPIRAAREGETLDVPTLTPVPTAFGH
ncbi:MAG TPA: MBL fold metallo-hydrolase [Actinomycetes bacterium]|nr:MBL fold metallo-hydrolase [Actinomycetes bacterium]